MFLNTVLRNFAAPIIHGGFVENKLAAVIRNHDFETLELALSEPNIFRSLSIARMEIRHSNFIAYLLDPRGTHGLGDVVRLSP